MKYRILILLFIVTGRVQSQDFDVVLSLDTLTIRETNIATDPFGFGENPLAYLKENKPKVTFLTSQNRHVDNKTDTVFTLTFDKDHFEVMKWDASANGIVAAELTTANFVTRYGLRVGLRKKEVIGKLSKYGIKTIPGYLILENLEVYELITFKFTGDILSKILFQGYID